ncbi:MAG: DNA polymerase III subunit alpha [candidate division WS1 bacterium]|jgi:error-prone DNA polymerase|nr:DNA polymerase III subunit alpha [candidate division WS1 bacterium]
MSFIHLHTHSAFSFYDGAAQVDTLARAVRDAGMSALALTDHDSLAGAVRFYQAALEAGIKPLIGVEFTIEPVLPELQEDPLRPPHLLLLAESNEGYSNLCRLVTAARLGEAQRASAFSAAYEEVDRDSPLLTQENLRLHSEHLIALTACRKRGEIPSLLERGMLREAQEVAEHYRDLFGPEHLFVELHNHLLPRPYSRARYRLSELAARMGLECVATNNVHYAQKSGYRLQDVMVCMGARQTVDEPNPDRRPNAEFYLKSPRQMAELFADQPQAIANAARIADRCEWELDLDTFHFPDFDLGRLRSRSVMETPTPASACGGAARAAIAVYRGEVGSCGHSICCSNGRGGPTSPTLAGARIGSCGPSIGSCNQSDLCVMQGRNEEGAGGGQPLLPLVNESPRAFLRRLCEAGAKRLYGHVEGPVRERLDHELTIIEDKGLAEYFLIVWDIVRFATEQGIHHTGRGSAGDSLVSYVLGITHADPLAHDLLFERFLNPERRNMPDIDVDFDTRRRDEVTKYIYDTYGAERVAAVCTVNTFRARSAIREIGKALGFSEEEIGKLASVFPHIRAGDISDAVKNYPEVRDAKLDLDDKRLLIELAGEIAGLPRHLSVHVGGLLIGRRPLTEMVPLELACKGIVIGQFDKDDVEALGLVKMDILGLRTHSAIEDALDHIEAREGVRPDIEALPLDDEPCYELLRGTHTVGLFQLESPGQRNLLGRVQPTNFEDIIANISLFRPGPVQADMITPYIMRRHGLQEVIYPHPGLEPILGSTFGVVIYQEQVLRIAHAIAGFSLGEADVLRRMMTKDITPEDLDEVQEHFVLRAGEQGVRAEVAEEIFGMVRGFAAYGFNKAHAACFARISYQTAWLKAHYPAEFLAGILSSQPMGFYPARTVAEDARRHGCGILPPCVNRSDDRCLVEYERNPVGDIRLGLWMVRGLQERSVERILHERERRGRFRSLEDFCARTSIPAPAVENLILARAFEFTGMPPQELLWRLRALPGDVIADRHGRQQSPTLAYDDVEDLVGMLPSLDPVSEVGRVATDLHILGVSTTRNPFSFWRERLRELDVTPSVKLWEREDGDRVRVAGIIVARARPPTRSGRTAIFISLEDELGLIDVAVFEDAYQKCGRALYTSPVICVEGKLTRLGALDLSVTAQDIIGLGSWQDFALRPVSDNSLGSAAHRNETALRQTQIRGGEGRQIAYY